MGQRGLYTCKLASYHSQSTTEADGNGWGFFKNKFIYLFNCFFFFYRADSQLSDRNCKSCIFPSRLHRL